MTKIIIGKSTLLSALEMLVKVINKNAAIPIIENFLLKEDKEKKILAISVTDLELCASLPLEYGKYESKPGAKPFVAVLPLEAVKYLRKLDDCPLTLSIDGVKLEILDDASKAKYTGFNPEDFPVTPEMDGKSFPVEFNPEALKTLAKYTGKDDFRPVMSGIFFDFKEKVQKTISTDAHRLVVYTSKHEPKKPESFIFPATMLKKMILPEETVIVPVKMDKEKKQMQFTWGEITYTVRLIDGNYPKFRTVIPKENPVSTTFDKKQMIKQIDKALLFCNQISKQVRLYLNSELEVSSEDLDFDREYKGRMQAENKGHGENFEIGFNGEFLRQIIMEGQTDTVTMQMSAPNRPFLIIEGGYEYLLMPVMLDTK